MTSDKSAERDGRDFEVDNDHEIWNFATGADEVNCPNTNMATWRYCPYCGERIQE